MSITHRCSGHYLLWQIGIAHRDISSNNLMYFDSDGDLVGVLNDFDLASVMAPGDRTPVIDGYERVGTRPFMALDLLQDQDEPFWRRYRHDLESFAWRFLWEMLKDDPNWTAKTIVEEHDCKTAYVARIGSKGVHVKIEWLPYFKFIITWFRACLDFMRDMNSRVVTVHVDGPGFKSEEEELAYYNTLEEEIMDREHVQPVIEAARKVVCDVDVEVIRDISWLDVKLLSTSNTLNFR